METMKTKSMFKALLLAVLISGMSLTGNAQEKQKDTTPQYEIVGNKVVKIKDKSKDPVKTKLIHTIKGVDYPVWKSARGKYFIIRTSKKSGKQYKQYLKIKQ